MDKMDRYEKFSLAACRARIAELESVLPAERTRREGLEARIRELEAALTDLYSLVRKQGMDEGLRQRIETSLDRGAKHE